MSFRRDLVRTLFKKELAELVDERFEEVVDVLTRRRAEFAGVATPTQVALVVDNLVDLVERTERNWDELCRVLAEVVYEATEEPEHPEKEVWPIRPQVLDAARAILAMRVGMPAR